MTFDQNVAFAVALVCLWFSVLIALNWHPARKHCRCCPNYMKGGSK